MKQVLLVIGILLIIACILLLIIGLLYMHAYHHLLDATAEHYRRLHTKMVAFYAGGTVLAVMGAICFMVRSKM